MMDMQERFAPLMAAALHYADSSEGLAMTLEDIQARILELADEERALPPVLSADGGRPDMPEARRRELEEARFAVYAWVDEKLLNARRPDAGSWMPLSLQCRYFSTTEAGQLFFSRLGGLLKAFGIAGEENGEPLDLAQRLERASRRLQNKVGVDALLMFALCLLYGFQGRLYGQDELLARVRRACRTLLLRPEILPAAETASAQHARQMLLQRLETAGYVLIPVIVCILFWLYCANILANIPAKGF
ncbi:MAG: DotU family type IV/VI secretion system protein [Clostridia bacterium]|nr:DotU family type IV/VI secretion system protein [Clostridia bacterium]